MKVKEIRALITKTNKELLDAISNENLELAKEKRDEIRKLTKDLKKAEEAEEDEEELRELKEKRKLTGGEKVNKEKRSYENALSQLNQGKVVSTRAIVVNNSSTEAVVPEEFLREVEKLKKGYGSLKHYCEVIPVSAPQGKRPVTEIGGKLAKLTPGQKLPEGSLNFGQLNYDCEAYGQIVAIDNILNEDSAVDLFGTIKENFAEAAVNTENEEILKQLEANKAEDISIGSLEGTQLIDKLIEIIDGYNPAVRKFVKIVADSSLRSKIKNSRMISGDGHLDERITMAGDTIYVDGHEVVEVDEALIPADSSKASGYVGPLKALKYFDRKSIEIAKSTEVLFESNATAIRVVERFDVVALDKAIVKPKKLVTA